MPNTSFAKAEAESHQIHRCDETPQGCAMVVLQEEGGRGIIELTRQHQLCDVKMRRVPRRQCPRRDLAARSCRKIELISTSVATEVCRGLIRNEPETLLLLSPPQCWIGRECNLKPETTPSSDCQDLYVNCATIILLISSLLFLETPSKK